MGSSVSKLISPILPSFKDHESEFKQRRHKISYQADLESDSDSDSDSDIPHGNPASSEFVNNGLEDKGPENGMDSLIPGMNKLQDLLSKIGGNIRSLIKIPEIVVIGGQSSGKSSVLEGLVKRSFLPRGVGIVTRCPIVLKLIHTPWNDHKNRKSENGTLYIREWCEFLHQPDKIFVNFNEVRKEIKKQTDRNAGTNKRISSTEISLIVYSPDVLDLTVVDLPGIVTLEVGDQPKEIVEEVHDLLLNRIKNPNSIILAISEASNDIATSLGLKLAREADPDGKRTIAVLTKLDLVVEVGRHNLIVDTLSGRVIPMELRGIIGVVNRSADNENIETIEDSIRAEKRFLEEKYPSIASKNGTPHLARKLNQLLKIHIKDCLPGLKKQVDEQICKCRTELDRYGSQIADKSEALLHSLTAFANAYNSAIKGSTEKIETKELRGGSRISYLLRVQFPNDISKIDFGRIGRNLENEDIIVAIRNANGVEAGLSATEVVFVKLAKEEIKCLKIPALKCVESVGDELKGISQSCWDQIQHDMNRFPNIQKYITNVVNKLVRRTVPIARKMVEYFILIQHGYIDKRDPVLVCKFLRSLDPDYEERGRGDELLFKDLFPKPGNTSDPVNPAGSLDNFRESLGDVSSDPDCRIIRKLVTSHFDIARKATEDTVRKIIMFSLVNDVKENLYKELISKLYNKHDDINKILSESPDIAEKRNEAMNTLQVLTEAKKLINKIYDAPE